MITFQSTATVVTDYNSYSLAFDGGLSPGAPYEPTHIMEEIDSTMHLSARVQSAELTVDVFVHDSRPALLPVTWTDVVERSLAPSENLAIGGWYFGIGVGPSMAIPAPTGTDLRLRYSIFDYDSSPWGVDGKDTGYRLDVWPEPWSRAAIIVQTSRRGRSDLASDAARRLRQDIYYRRATSTRRERIGEFADRMFGDFPEILDSFRSSDLGRDHWLVHSAEFLNSAAFSGEEGSKAHEPHADAPSTFEIIAERASIAGRSAD